jgi:hypothetical protein
MSIAWLIHRRYNMSHILAEAYPHAAVDIVIKSMHLVMCLHIALTDKKISQHLPDETGRSSDRTKK